MGGGFPIDLVLFGMVAVFLVLRLVSILGKRTGFEQQAKPLVPEPAMRGMPQRAAPGVIDAVAEPVPTAPRNLPDPASPLGMTLSAMAGVDRGFSPQRFLDGAEAAFRIIVAAFAAGDRVKLHPLLSSETYAAFEGAIAAREAEGHTQSTEIRSIESISIVHAELAGSVANITVKFVSDQVSVTLGENGLPVAGADAVMEITDLWTFERDLSQSDPAWRLIAAHSA